MRVSRVVDCADYNVRDLSLAAGGRLKIQWAAAHMPLLNRIRDEFAAGRPFAGQRVAICLHLEAKTAYLAKVLKECGAEVAITGSNPLSTQDDVAAALVEDGLHVYSYRGCNMEDYRRLIGQTLSIGPTLVIDDGGDLVNMLHSDRRDLAEGVIGGCEETTTGILRLRAMDRDGALLFPMIAVNDAYCKHLFDNRYGTGQSVWDGIIRTTNLVVAGKVVVIAGYGWCGKGVAMRAKGLGARVVICEVNPIRALEARMDGYDVMRLSDAAREGDIFITVTGCRDVIRREHFLAMKDGAILANAGHFDVEVSIADLAALSVSRRQVRANIEEFVLAAGQADQGQADQKDQKRLYLLGEGRLVNLACADGHPAEIMDMSFALQFLSLNYLAREGDRLGNHLYKVPEDIDLEVAELKLASEGISIDSLSPEQRRYIESWQG
ncbi:MAG: adenosylhomocysteinase [Firmicutes bacterium]|nr:adenosylhomocysteinase [Bacillota bacterium]